MATAPAAAPPKPLVGIIMGSTSDWEVMQEAKKTLDALQVPCEAEVVSAHRTPDRMFAYASAAAGRGLQVIIAGAGGAAHLPGMTAAKTILPVIGVPCPTTQLIGLDALLSIVQMPKGTPVATVAVGKPGAANAGFLAAQILALHDPTLAARILAYKDARRDEVLASRLA